MLLNSRNNWITIAPSMFTNSKQGLDNNMGNTQMKFLRTQSRHKQKRWLCFIHATQRREKRNIPVPLNKLLCQSSRFTTNARTLRPVDPSKQASRRIVASLVDDACVTSAYVVASLIGGDWENWEGNGGKGTTAKGDTWLCNVEDAGQRNEYEEEAGSLLLRPTWITVGIQGTRSLSEKVTPPIRSLRTHDRFIRRGATTLRSTFSDYQR